MHLHLSDKYQNLVADNFSNICCELVGTHWKCLLEAHMKYFYGVSRKRLPFVGVGGGGAVKNPSNQKL